MSPKVCTLRTVPYVHVVLEGSAYEVGRCEGEHLARQAEAARFFTAPLPARGALPPQRVDAALRFFDQHCPGLNEEIQGCADVLHVKPEGIVYYTLTFDPPALSLSGLCSQIVALPSHTANGHLLVGRNYDFSDRMSDLRLATTRIQGRAAHLGFSELLFGRNDGLNEHGLCVTMSAGAPMAPFEPRGCTFWALVRTLLDRCAKVDEALDVIAGIPVSSNLNLVIADRSGQAAHVEIASSHRAIQRIGSESPHPFLIATNHFTMPELLPFDRGRRWNSVKRHQTIRHRLGLAGRGVTVETLRGILTDPMPEGVCGHDYSGFFGTLWSEIFDVTTGVVEICFGAPTHNPWRSFDLSGSVGRSEYATQLPDTPAPARFWQKLEPGTEI